MPTLAVPTSIVPAAVSSARTTGTLILDSAFLNLKSTPWNFRQDGNEEISFSNFQNALKGYYQKFHNGDPNRITFNKLGGALNSYGYDLSDWRLGRYLDESSSERDTDGLITAQEIDKLLMNMGVLGQTVSLPPTQAKSLTPEAVGGTNPPVQSGTPQDGLTIDGILQSLLPQNTTPGTSPSLGLPNSGGTDTLYSLISSLKTTAGTSPSLGLPNSVGTDTLYSNAMNSFAPQSDTSSSFLGLTTPGLEALYKTAIESKNPALLSAVTGYENANTQFQQQVLKSEIAQSNTLIRSAQLTNEGLVKQATIGLEGINKIKDTALSMVDMMSAARKSAIPSG
ncbi:MAG: hypothetical protein ACJARD_001632 [Alphaproteobacteria bacterium]